MNLVSTTNFFSIFFFFCFYFETYLFCLTTSPTADVLILSSLTYLRQSSVHIHSKNSKYQQVLSKKKNYALASTPTIVHNLKL